MNQAIDQRCNWNDDDVLYSDLEATSRGISAVAIYCFGSHKIQFISSLIDRTVINISQRGNRLLADLNLPGNSCTFACQKSIYVCALRTAYSLTQWLNFHILSLEYAKCSSHPAYH